MWQHSFAAKKGPSSRTSLKELEFCWAARLKGNRRGSCLCFPLCAANSFHGSWSQVTGKALQKKSEFHLKLMSNSSDLHCAECQTWNHCDKIHVDNQTATFPRKQPASWRKTVIDTSRKAFRVIEEGKYYKMTYKKSARPFDRNSSDFSWIYQCFSTLQAEAFWQSLTLQNIVSRSVINSLEALIIHGCLLLEQQNWLRIGKSFYSLVKEKNLMSLQRTIMAAQMRNATQFVCYS